MNKAGLGYGLKESRHRLEHSGKKAEEWVYIHGKHGKKYLHRVHFLYD
jgi:hypothetical protein